MKKLFISITLFTFAPFLCSSNENKNLPITTADELVYISYLHEKYQKTLSISTEEIDYVKDLYREYSKKRLFLDTYVPPTILITNLLKGRKEELLIALKKEYKNNPSFCKTYSIKALEIAINLLEERIKITKNTMVPANMWNQQKEIITSGCIPIVILTGLSIPIIYEIYKKHQEFISGKFNHINISSALFNKLSLTRFTLAEKRYLQRFSVEKITVNDHYDERWYPSYYAKKNELSTNHLSTRGKEKLTYTALDYATKKHWVDIKEDVKSKMLNPLLRPAPLLACAMTCFSFLIAFFQPQITADQLKKDRNLHNVLEKELESRFSFCNKSI